MRVLKDAKMSAEEEAVVAAILEAMEADARYNTPSRYSSNTALYPDNVVTFSAGHMNNLRKYPNINPDQYIQNLKLITRIR